jgi:uncharacterized protein YjbJ (UPF0337 family)
MDNEFEGKWKQFRGEIRRKWGKLTDDDFDQVKGSWERFVGRLQERYGKSQADADREAKSFFDSLSGTRA